MGPDVQVLGLDISGSRALVGLVDRRGHVANVRTVTNTTGDAATYWPRVLNVAAEVAEQAKEPVPASGVSFGGPVGLDGRIVSIHVPGWTDLDPAAELQERLGVSVVIENDANCGAVGEHRYGRWGRPQTLIFLTCSTGIGGGIVSAGALFKGSRGLAGELGHIPVTTGHEGMECACGARGCLEAQCSGTAIGRRATAALAASREQRSVLADCVVEGEIPGAKPVFDAAEIGDELASEVLGAVFVDFGRGIAAIQNAFDPDLIIIGGGVGQAGEALSKPVASAARNWVMRGRRTHVRVETAALGVHAQLCGAAALAWDNV